MRAYRKIVVALCTGAMGVLVAPPGSAQEKAGQEKQAAQEKQAEAMKLKKPEMTQYKALASLVDAVSAGKEPAPADVKLRLRPQFVKSTAGVYAPYVLEISSGRFTSFPVAIYVRAVSKSAPAAVDGKANYPFDDIYFINDAKSLRSAGGDVFEFSRGLQLPPGEFDVYVAMMETPPRNKSAGPGKRVVHTQALSVPDFSSGLTTSSVILARSLDDSPQVLTADKQLDEPFTFGGYRITPAATSSFAKSDELLFLFFIYNEAAGPGGKPDVDVNYFFYRAAETKPFSKAATSSFNPTTLPAEFDLKAGHQLVVGQGIPLASFAPGDYKLELRITDKVQNQTIMREIPFTVTP
jgi:hypothetical protein